MFFQKKKRNVKTQIKNTHDNKNEQQKAQAHPNENFFKVNKSFKSKIKSKKI